MLRGSLYLRVLILHRCPVVVAGAFSAAEMRPSASAAWPARPRTGALRSCSCEAAPANSSKQRRPRHRNSTSDLRTVPGVGVKNEQLLVSKGIGTVKELRSLYQKLNVQSTDPKEYLQKEVGIRKQFCASIVDHLSKEDEEKNSGDPRVDNRRITLAVEGNISSGKSTFLNWLMEEPLQVAGICEVVPEPVKMWQSVGGNPENNLLDRFYGDAKKYAYEFQNYVFLTRLQQNHNTWAGDKPLRILERSVFSDRLVFVRAVHEAQWLSDMQLELYDSWFNPMLREVPGLVPDGFIYLRADPTTCMRRLHLRGRQEEATVPEEYLNGLHRKHEEWFTGRKALMHDTKTVIDIHPQAPQAWRAPSLPDCLKDSVIWLGEGSLLQNQNPRKLPDEVCAAMNQVPALVLDCDHDIDVVNDVEAKTEYTQKVLAYYKYVKACRQHMRSIRPFWSVREAEEMRTKWKLVTSAFNDQEFSRRMVNGAAFGAVGANDESVQQLQTMPLENRTLWSAVQSLS